jgi:aryl-alcohol dehydrogenase-like predicted oxidoreductase
MNQKVSTVLVGFSNTTHVDEAVACSEMASLSDQQMSEISVLWRNDFGKLSA